MSRNVPSRKRKPATATPLRRGDVRLALAVTFDASTRQALPSRAQCRRWLCAALAHNTHDAQVGLRFVDAPEGRALNKQFRNKDYATNVLTFVYPSPGDALMGDIVVCTPVIEREAREQSKALKDHYAHMVIHAALHLQGEDHENDADAARMEAQEIAILRRFRIANPYE